jgi:hypothetical protein
MARARGCGRGTARSHAGASCALAEATIASLLHLRDAFSPCRSPHWQQEASPPVLSLCRALLGMQSSIRAEAQDPHSAITLSLGRADEPPTTSGISLDSPFRRDRTHNEDPTRAMSDASSGTTARRSCCFTLPSALRESTEIRAELPLEARSGSPGRPSPGTVSMPQLGVRRHRLTTGGAPCSTSPSLAF